MAPAPGRHCDECGQEHVAKINGARPCMGHANIHDEATDRIVGKRPCMKGAMRGLDVCRNHGGSSPQAKAKAQRQLAEEKAEKVLRRFGAPIDTSPTEGLLDMVRWTAGYVAWLREKVAEVESDDALIWGVTKETQGDVVVGDGAAAELQKATTTVSEAKPNAWLVLLAEWSDRHIKACSEAIRCGIEERRVRLAEQQGALVADVIRAILGDLDLTPEQTAKAGQVVPIRLRAIAGGAA